MTKRLQWIEWYHELEKYYAEYGNIDIAQKYETEDGLKLGRWLSTQRLICKDAKREKLLNKLGMNWDISMENWDKNYYALEEYYKKNGNIDVPFGYETKEGLKLGSWLHNQRKAYKGKDNHRITKDQIQLLNDLGMRWEVQKENWDKNYYALEEYYKKNGNIDIPENYVTQEGVKLGSWLNNQRSAYKGKGKSKITEDQIQLLNDLGIKWEVQKEKWNEFYSALKKYYEEHGNINVPRNYITQKGIKLGTWLNTQRRAYNGKSKCKITEDQIQLLNGLNIEWSICDTKLLKMKIEKENRDKYYRVLDDRLSHVLTDISYEISNEITEKNQEELCKQIVKRMWR